jgi:Fic family protein
MRTGNYQHQLQGDLTYKAFVPNQLPFKINLSDKLQSLLSRADLALGRLDGMADTLPDLDFFILMYVRKEATISSQIEGTQATFIDVLKKEAKFEDAEVHKDVDEILNYITAMNYGLTRLTEFPLSLRLIKEIHQKLLANVRGQHKTPGEFRTSQNWIGGPTIETATFVPPPRHEVLPLMGNLETFMHDIAPMPVLLKTGLIHAQFETIHPFLDGNGRTGRLIITFYLCQQGALHKPLLYLSEYFKRNRQTYYDRLNSYRVNDDIEGWLEFFLQGIIETSEKAVDTSRKIILLKEKSVQKIATLGKSTANGMKMLNTLFGTPMVRIKDVERILSLKNPNALAIVTKLEQLNILKEITGNQRNRVFSFFEYVKLFE